MCVCFSIQYRLRIGAFHPEYSVTTLVFVLGQSLGSEEGGVLPGAPASVSIVKPSWDLIPGFGVASQGLRVMSLRTEPS